MSMQPLGACADARCGNSTRSAIASATGANRRRVVRRRFCETFTIADQVVGRKPSVLPGKLVRFGKAVVSPEGLTSIHLANVAANWSTLSPGINWPRENACGLGLVILPYARFGKAPSMSLPFGPPVPSV